MPVFGYVVVHPRYSHDTETLETRSPVKGVDVLNRARQFSYPPLERRADGTTQLGTFDLGVHVTNDVLFSM